MLAKLDVADLERKIDAAKPTLIAFYKKAVKKQAGVIMYRS